MCYLSCQCPVSLGLRTERRFAGPRSERPGRAVVGRQTRGMVKTGARAETLSRMLTRLGHRRSATSPRPPRLESVSPDLVPDLMDVYRRLGGPLDAVVFRPGSWDLSFDDGLLVELDEELHFNRYRRLTLTPEWAEPLAWRADYLDLCARREADCLKAAIWGKRWTNPSCEAMFGVVGEPGVLEGPGAPALEATRDVRLDQGCVEPVGEGAAARSHLNPRCHRRSRGRRCPGGQGRARSRWAHAAGAAARHIGLTRAGGCISHAYPNRRQPHW